MNTRFLAGVMGASVLVTPLTFGQAKKHPTMSPDMREAIAFERHKEQAAAAQARKEARHPSVVSSDHTANRSAEESEPGRPVKDPGPAPRKVR